MQFIHPKLVLRDSVDPLEVDDDDLDFIREPTGLFALYMECETNTFLLTSTEEEGHWDVIARVRPSHFKKLRNLFRIGELLSGATRKS